MQEILKGRQCFLGIDVAQVGAVQNAVKIDTHIISPSGVVSCVANGYDELKKVVGLIISADIINELGAYSIDLRLVFADAVIVVPTFAFAEAVEGEAPCYGISEVYVKIEGGEVVPSGSTTVEFVNREEFEQLSNKVDDLEEQIESGGGGSITIDAELSETSNNAIANSAVAKAIGNTATKTELEVVQKETQENSKILAGLTGSAVDFSPTIAYENSEVINGQVSAYPGYQVTAPIFLNKGDTIALTSYSGGGTQAISLTDANGSFYTSIDATPSYKTRTYTAIEDCYVALSWLNIATYPRTITIESASNIPNIINRIEALERGATPSGDPMHYVYEGVGAHWNDDTGYWEFYDMVNITNAEMSKAFARGSWYIGASAIGVLSAFNEQSSSAIRFNIARTGPSSVTCDLDDFASENKWIEFINLTFDNNLVSKPFTYASYLTGSFNGCSNLRRIYGEINVTNTTNEFTDTFTGCVKLEDVEIYGLNKNVSFADSPLLSKESLLYMIRNSVQGAEFTITLHPDVYYEAKDGEWEEEVTSAINEYGENITLAEA